MNKTDLIMKNYLSDNNRFADIINYYLYDGKQIIKNTDLKELDTTSVISEDKRLTERTRDLLKEFCVKIDDNYTYAIIGIENQTKEAKNMIARVMSYDSITYLKQFDNKKNNAIIKMKPVITLVIYYGKKRWSSPRTLHELLNLNENDKLAKMVPNYHLNLIEPYFMTDEDIEKFQTELKVLFDFYRNTKSKEDLKGFVNKKYQANSDTIDVINYLTDSNIKIEEKEGEINMCKAWDELVKEYRDEGIQEGEAKGKAEGKAEGIKENEIKNIKTMNKNGADIETISKLLDLDIGYVKEVLNS